jgi:hypothetical protein
MQKIFSLSQSQFIIILLLTFFWYDICPLTLTAKSQPEASSTNQQQDGSSRGRPSKRGSTGSRSNCPSVKLPLSL